MMWYLVLAIVIFRINFLDVEGNYNPGHGKQILLIQIPFFYFFLSNMNWMLSL